MTFNDLSYNPQSILERAADWVSRRYFNLKRRYGEGLDNFTTDQWRMHRTLFSSGLVARRIFFMIASGMTYSREPKELAEIFNQIREEWEPEATEENVQAAFSELQQNGLFDQNLRPRITYDIVE